MLSVQIVNIVLLVNIVISNKIGQLTTALFYSIISYTLKHDPPINSLIKELHGIADSSVMSLKYFKYLISLFAVIYEGSVCGMLDSAGSAYFLNTASSYVSSLLNTKLAPSWFG